MSKVPFGAVSARSESQETDPRALTSFHDDRPEIQALFERALEAKLPRSRDLKPYEPARLNERHLSMVMMRAGGMKQRTIAQVFGVTDSNVSIVLNHPDAEYLLSRLQAMRATQPTDIESRLAALTGSALDSLEAAFDDSLEPGDLKNAVRRAPLAFRVLEMNGHGRKKQVEVEHQHTHKHQLEASPKQLSDLTAALREAKEIPEADYVVLGAGEADKVLSLGGEPPVSHPRELPQGTGAPSISDSQEQDPDGEEEAA